VANGGSGRTSHTAYAVICGGTGATTAQQSIVSVGTASQVLTSNGAGALPTFQDAGSSSISITGDTGGALVGSAFTFTGGTTGLSFGGSGSTETLSGTLVVANGGTGATTLTDHGVLVGSGTGAVTPLAVGTDGQVLIGSSAADPVFATLTSTGATITFTPGAGTLNLEAVAAANLIVHTDGSDATEAAGAISILGGTGITTSGSTSVVTLTLDTPVAVTNGGTGLTSFTQGDVIYSSATNTLSALAKDVSATRYLSNTGASNNPAWSQIALATGVSGTLPVANGGTSSTSLTQYNVLIGNNVSAIATAAPSATAGVPLVSQGAAANPAFGTAVVAGGGSGRTTHTAYAVICGGTTTTAAQQSIASVGTSGQVLTSNGAGALPTFQTVSSGGLTWNEETGTSATMTVGNGYIANNASLVTLTLPTTAAIGDTVRVTGKGAGGWRIAQNAGETINFGSSTTTSGATGYIEFTQQYDSVELVCITADTVWNVISSVGNITIS